MNIAVLAWGSLYWDKRELDLAMDWSEGGVVLPIEFARISKDGRLTLVITEEYGTEIETYWAFSKYSKLDEAIENLRVREGTIKKGIGYVDLNSDEKQSKLPQALLNKISDWAIEKSIDAVIWTELKSNFSEKYNEEFSYENAKNYLNALSGEVKEKADDYIHKAPPLTTTKLRKLIK